MLWHKGGENNKQNQKLRYTWTFSELQLLHHSRNAKYTPQVLETNTRRGLTSCFPCKSFQVTCAIWNVHLVSVSQKKHWTIPLCSHISSQVYDIRSLAPNTAAGWTHTSPELQGTSHTDCILQHRQGDLSLRSKTTNCRPFRNLHRFGTKQQVQEIISFKREVGVKLTFLSYLMLSPTAKRRLGGEAGGKVHLSLKMSSSYFFTSDFRLCQTASPLLTAPLGLRKPPPSKKSCLQHQEMTSFSSRLSLTTIYTNWLTGDDTVTAEDKAHPNTELVHQTSCSPHQLTQMPRRRVEVRERKGKNKESFLQAFRNWLRRLNILVLTHGLYSQQLKKPTGIWARGKRSILSIDHNETLIYKMKEVEEALLERNQF